MTPKLHQNTKAVLKARNEEAVPAMQTTAVALSQLASAVTTIAEFVSNGGLLAVLQGQARANAVSSVITGLIGKDGRGGLDPRVVKQNALETAHMVEAFFEAYQKKLTQQTEGHDSELKDAEADFNKRS